MLSLKQLKPEISSSVCSTNEQFYVYRREIASRIYDHRRMPTRKKKNTHTVFGKRLRQIRKYRKLPQYKLGVLAGLEESSSSARMSRYETGLYEPTFQFAETLAGILAISPSYLFCPEDQLAELILVFSTLPDRKRQELLQVAKELAKEG